MTFAAAYSIIETILDNAVSSEVPKHRCFYGSEPEQRHGYVRVFLYAFVISSMIILNTIPVA